VILKYTSMAILMMQTINKRTVVPKCGKYVFRANMNPRNSISLRI
jgi:hypothetical protein